MKIEQLLDTDKLRSHIAEKLVAEQPNRTFGSVKIYNYGRTCQFDPNAWDEVTEKTRGLIVDWDDGEVLARPFRKFFNLGTGYRPETHRDKVPNFEPEVTKKMDGSLGILWKYKGEFEIATRGSFGSSQARWATKFFHKNYGFDWPEGWTPLFEIIYPENRIVVKYDREEMVLLAMVNIETGEEMPHAELSKWAATNGMPVVELYNGKSLDEMTKEERENEEGYVLTWHKPSAEPLKVKVKFIEYCRIHRLVTGLSPKALWEKMRDGDNLDEEFEGMPAHFREWADVHIDRITADYQAIESAALKVFAARPKTDDRKTLALYFTQYPAPIPGVCFALLDGKNESEAIWKTVRPKPEDAFKTAVVEV